MNMFKKVLGSIALAFVALCTLSSCGKKVTYDEFVAKTKEVEKNEYNKAVVSLKIIENKNGASTSNTQTINYKKGVLLDWVVDGELSQKAQQIGTTSFINLTAEKYALSLASVDKSKYTFSLEGKTFKVQNAYVDKTDDKNYREYDTIIRYNEYGLLVYVQYKHNVVTETEKTSDSYILKVTYSKEDTTTSK